MKSVVLALKQDLVDIKRSLNLILSSTAAYGPLISLQTASDDGYRLMGLLL